MSASATQGGHNKYKNSSGDESKRELLATFLSLRVYVYLKALLHSAPRKLPNSVK